MSFMVNRGWGTAMADSHIRSAQSSACASCVEGPDSRESHTGAAGDAPSVTSITVLRPEAVDPPGQLDLWVGHEPRLTERLKAVGEALPAVETSPYEQETVHGITCRDLLCAGERGNVGTIGSILITRHVRSVH